jgi:SAM-dependent methyltransferase
VAVGTDHKEGRTWETVARTNPYWGVLSQPEFDGVDDSDTRLEAFWASGEAHVAHVFEVLEARVRAGFQPRTAVDFGCGVGRLLVPLARRCREVYGVDVAPSMRSLAQRHLRERGISNVTLAATLDELAVAPRTMDLVHSVLVLQHLRPRAGLAALATLIELLAPGGCGVVHLYLGRRVPWWRQAVGQARERSRLVNSTVSLLRGDRTTKALPYEMNPYRLFDVFAVLGDGGITDVWCENTVSADSLDTVIYFSRSA